MRWAALKGYRENQRMTCNTGPPHPDTMSTESLVKCKEGTKPGTKPGLLRSLP